MKLLVGGCSFSDGWGFDQGIHNPGIWPNLLAKQLNATLTNVSQNLYDNPGIFLRLIKELTTTHYDLILFQITGLNRIVVSPTVHGSFRIVGDVPQDRIDTTDYKNFHRVFVTLNKDFEHWHRFMNIILTVQNLVKQGYNIRLINGLLDWDPGFFNNNMSSFAKSIMDFDNSPDEDVEKMKNILNQDKKKIDLDLWLNPFESMFQTKVDTVAPKDSHPGPVSQTNYTKMIVKKLNLL